MAGTIVEVEIPSEQFALEQTLQRLETVRFDIEQLVASKEDLILPFVWVRTGKRDEIEDAFGDDDTVDDFQLVAEFDDEYLYQLEWSTRIEVLVNILVKQKGTVLAASGKGDKWNLRLLFGDRDAITETNEYCVEKGIDLEVQNIKSLSGHEEGRFGLSQEQRDALQVASDRGYYSVPRETSAEELAEELGISHQALSERLRRAHDALVTNTVVLGHGPTASSTDGTAAD